MSSLVNLIRAECARDIVTNTADVGGEDHVVHFDLEHICCDSEIFIL